MPCSGGVQKSHILAEILKNHEKKVVQKETFLDDFPKKIFLGGQNSQKETFLDDFLKKNFFGGFKIP